MLAVEGESSHLPEVGEVPYQPEHHIFPKCQFSKSKVVSHAFQGLISGSGYTTSQQLTACLCLEVNTNLHCLEHSELFFMHVSVSNLHFPQMKLVSEKPPESVLEGVIFKIFLGEHAPRSPLYYGVQSMPFLIPYGNLARQVFLMFVQKQQRSI